MPKTKFHPPSWAAGLRTLPASYPLSRPASSLPQFANPPAAPRIPFFFRAMTSAVGFETGPAALLQASRSLFRQGSDWEAMTHEATTEAVANVSIPFSSGQ